MYYKQYVVTYLSYEEYPNGMWICATETDSRQEAIDEIKKLRAVGYRIQVNGIEQ